MKIIGVHACALWALLLSGCDINGGNSYLFPQEVVNASPSILEFSHQAYAIPLEEEQWIKGDFLHLYGNPVDIYFFDKANYSKFESSRKSKYIAPMSRTNVSSSFETKWFRAPTDGIYYFVIAPVNVKNGRWDDAGVRVNIEACTAWCWK